MSKDKQTDKDQKKQIFKSKSVLKHIKEQKAIEMKPVITKQEMTQL